MTRLEGRREVQPSKRVTKHRSPGFGSSLNISVPISFGLPLIAVGIALVVAGARSGAAFLWIAGVVVLGGGLLLFATGKRL
jgi:hypothetical protein